MLVEIVVTCTAADGVCRGGGRYGRMMEEEEEEWEL